MAGALEAMDLIGAQNNGLTDNLAEAARRLEAERALRAAHQEEVDRLLARIAELEAVT